MGTGWRGRFEVGAIAPPSQPGFPSFQSQPSFLPAVVIPAKAGIHNVQAQPGKCLLRRSWIPAFAGMTVLQSGVSVTVGMSATGGWEPAKPCYTI